MTKKIIENHLSQYTIPFLEFDGSLSYFCWKKEGSSNGHIFGKIGGAIKSELYLIDLILFGDDARRHKNISDISKKEYLERIDKVLSMLQ